MFCFPEFKHHNNKLIICSTQNSNQFPGSVIQMTTTSSPKIVSSRVTMNGHMPPMTDAEIIFAYASLYILFPLLYIIISTGDITPLTMIWRFIQSGVFGAVERIQSFISNLTYYVLRVFGQYSFSTYTVVQNGREIYKASSLFYYYPTNEDTVYNIDRAKYDVCKWIDAQCSKYQLQYNGELPELTVTHNDIYDFILHKVDGQPYTRIHRGDFTGRTNTLYYRPFCKSYQFAESAELTVAIPKTDADADAKHNAVSETFTFQLKHPDHFFVEKNEILDKKFLQWKLYNECGRKDVANYIGLPFSNYIVKLYYNETPKPDTIRTVAFTTDDSNYILFGKHYAVKVDTILRCPVFDSNETQVLDIDCVLSHYYSDSETEENKNVGAQQCDSDSESDSDSEDSEVNEHGEHGEDNKNPENIQHKNNSVQETHDTKDEDAEFEILEKEK